MKDNSLYKLGGTAAILVGLTYIVTGVTNIFIPSSLNGIPEAQSQFMHWQESKTLILVNWWATLINAFFALAMIPAVSKTVQHFNEGWVRWTTTLATLAFCVVILDNYWSIVYTDARAQVYLSGSEAARTDLSIPGSPQFIDVQGWLALGAVGLWILTCSYLALKNNVWPKGLAYLGILGAIIYFLGLVAYTVPSLYVSGGLVTVGVIGAILGPVIYTWMGIYLRRLEG